MVEQDVERIIQTMAAKGLRITEQRRTLVRLFADTPGFLTPKEVYFRLELKHSGLSYDTVYRNLRIMQEMGVLEQFHFEEGMKFRLGCHGHTHQQHHHHLICVSCSLIFPLAFCPMDTVDIPDTFQVIRHSFEVYGYCAQCNKQENPKAPITKSA